MSHELAALSINETIPIAATSGSMSDRRAPTWVRMARLNRTTCSIRVCRRRASIDASTPAECAK